jgi:hypothetical protein
MFALLLLPFLLTLTKTLDFGYTRRKKDVFMSPLLHLASFALMPNTNLSLQGTTQQTTQ